jgi:hypothetical protein
MQGIPEGRQPSDENAELSADTNRNCNAELVEHVEGSISLAHDRQADQSLPVPAQGRGLAEPFHPDVSPTSLSTQERNLMVRLVDVNPRRRPTTRQCLATISARSSF